MTSERRRRAEARGRRGERIAALYLQLKGYRILARRYRTPVGEIDLIARKGSTLAFVEVKTRPTLKGGIEAVTDRQRRRSTRAVLTFLMQHPHAAGLDLRFDAVVVRPWGWPRHIVNAWEAQGEGLP